ncbi:3957_t:CDS:2 [Cetraspora pellucida]|uniref:3957_t:CDS:1 n=1 Tax=Cetraspora pellucida TaxID=1433469 RepID=A0A9N9BP85_9GLOM|nr:3957_t:CDS:2 [Cetraspora pellucida]
MSYVGQEEQSATITITGMYSQLAINTALGFGTLIIFGFLRPRNGIVYAPKQKYSPEKKQPPKLKSGLFSWIKPVISVSESQLIEKIGLDALQWFWIHAVFTWIFSALIYWLVYKQYRDYAELKMNYFESDEYQTSLHSRTLLVTNVPHSMQSDQGLLKLMDSFNVKYPISQAHIARKVGKLPELLKKHEVAVRKLESVLVKYLNDPENLPEARPTHHIEGLCGPSIDSIECYTQEIQSLENQIFECRNAISDRKPLNYGFVSFINIPDAHKVAKDLRDKSIIQRTQHVVTPKVMLAPLPKDIIWSNLSISDAIRGPKILIGHALFIVLCFFWLVPITFIITLARIKNIEYLLPFTKGLSKNGVFSGVLEAWMSPIIMAVFFLILPSILRQLAKQQGKITRSSLDRSTLGKLYLFFMINSIIIYTCASTIVGVWTEIRIKIDEGDANLRDIYNVIKKSNFFDEIADSMIKVSTFWINYISLRGVGAIIDLAQVASLMMKFIKRRFVKPTPRNLKEFSRPPDFDYPEYYNLHLFFFTIGILYSVISPLILFFCFAYFALAYLIYRYQLMYVFTTKIETAGSFWRLIFNRIVFSTIFWQITMIGVMNLKDARIQSFAILPLPCLTVLFKVFCHRQFDQKIRYYTPREAYLESCKTNDSRDLDHLREKVSTRFGHPSLTAEIITPMVHSNAKDALSKVYRGRVSETKENRRGTIKSMSMFVDGNNALKIQTVEESELEVDEDAYLDEQNPGYYTNYDEPQLDSLPQNQHPSVSTGYDAYYSPPPPYVKLDHMESQNYRSE